MNELLLKRYRKKANITQKEAANALNVSQPYYSRLENGTAIPDAHQLLELSKIFNCTPNDLYGLDGAMSAAIDPLFEEYKELVKKIKK